MDRPSFLNRKIKCDLEELCEGSTPNSRGEFCVECPECLKVFGESKYKLYIKKDKSVGYCHRCHSVFINKDKGPEDIQISELRTPSFLCNTEVTNYSLDKIDTSYYQYSKDFSKDEVDYLIRRNPELGDLYKGLGFKFRKTKIVMPFYWNNEVFYYQIRSTLNRDEAPLPYFCPPIDNKPIWISPLNKGTSELIITEGIFGAIGAWLKFNKERDVISLQGSYLTKYQLWMIDNFSYNKFYIYCDEWEISYNVMHILKNHNPLIYDNCRIIKSEFGDPEDDYLRKTVIH